MANPFQEEQSLKAKASTIAQISIDALLHPPKAGSFNFESENEFFETILAFYNDIAATSFRVVPTPTVTEAGVRADQIIIALNRIADFDAKAYDPNQEQRNIMNNLRSQWHEAYHQIVSHLALARVASTSLKQDLQTTRGVIQAIADAWKTAEVDFTKKTNDANDKLIGKMEELEKVMTAARDVSAKAAVSEQSKEFHDEAEKCLKASKQWFAGTIAAVATSLVVIYCMFLKDLNAKPADTALVSLKTNPPASLTNAGVPIKAPAEASVIESKPITAALLQQTVARILIVTLLYSAVVWCARNCFACRHNYTVNRHRRNAMQTFRAFVAGTKDEATKDFILRQAAACAFAPQQSGYLKDESLPIPGPVSQLIESAKAGGKGE